MRRREQWAPAHVFRLRRLNRQQVAEPVPVMVQHDELVAVCQLRQRLQQPQRVLCDTARAPVVRQPRVNADAHKSDYILAHLFAFPSTVCYNPRMSIELPASFYLGKKYDLKTSTLLDEPLNYSASDLTTHAVIVGMTGSGKTGLGISLLEEVALDGIPALIIDPKGDLTNLLLSFPQLRPEDFLPWIDSNPPPNRQGSEVAAASLPGAAAAGGRDSLVAEAVRAAAEWNAGLAEWGIGGARIQRLRDSAEFTIYTPGSEAGVPVNILDALRVPPGGWESDPEDLREKIQGIVSAVLGLSGLETDPLRSREHILLSHLVEQAWRAGRDMDIEQLILGIQNPAMRKLGVFDLDTFFPPKDRFELAMALNSILAAPSFETWLKGVPFDIASFLWSSTGGSVKPRHSIFYIAHLSDAERMFFVSLLLQQVRSWMRAQPGTNNLRALLFFDELFGYLPPYPHNPSTKTPLLFVLKNARAYGLGLVLATQNPIDLDYKALTNAGTWFIGKLQTQYDKARLLDGLQTAAGESGAALDREQLNDVIGALSPRVFLYHNVHQPPPIAFKSRWAMSYLKGPLTRPQIRSLRARTNGQAAAQTGALVEPDSAAPAAATVASAAPSAYASEQTTISVVSPEIAQYYLPPAPARPDAATTQPANPPAVQPVLPAANPPMYLPYLLAVGTVTFDNRKTSTRHSVTQARLLSADQSGAPLDWANGELISLAARDLQTVPPAAARFAGLPKGFANPQKLDALQRAFVQYLYRESTLVLRLNKTLKIVENPDETEGAFRQHCAEAARVGLEAEQQKIKTKYAKQLDKLAERLQKQQNELSSEQKQLEGRKHEELWANIESIAAFLGFGRAYRPLSTASRRRRQTQVTASTIQESQDTIEGLKQKLNELQKELDSELQAARAKWIAAQDAIEELKLVPRKSDIHIDAFGIAWRP
jgi:hypothetical protein